MNKSKAFALTMLCVAWPVISDASHRYMSINNSVTSTVRPGKKVWDPGDAVTVSGQLRANNGTNCTNAGPVVSLASYDVVILPPQTGMGPGHQICDDGYEFTVSPGTDSNGNFSFAMQGGGVSFTGGDGVNDPGSIVQLEFTYNSAPRTLVCGNSSTYPALGSACSSAPEIYGVLASPDINGDGELDTSDVSALGTYLGDPQTLNWAWQMDFDQNGAVDAQDVAYYSGRDNQSCDMPNKVATDYDMNVANLEDAELLAFLQQHEITIAQVIAAWDAMGLSYDVEAAQNLVVAHLPSAVAQKSWGHVKSLYRD